jgi:hypothetical protein
MSEPLLPCPFCGGNAMEYAYFYQQYQVICRDCAAMVEGWTQKKANEKWNNRRSTGLLNWLDSEIAKYRDSLDQSFVTEARRGELERCRKMVRRLMSQ